MKITKRILPTVLMLALGFLTLHAQRNTDRPPMDPEKMAEKQTARMTEKLGLDEKQAEKVEAINLKYAKQQVEKKEKAKAEREEMKAERKKTQDARMAELKQVLTSEQYTELEKAQAEMGDRMRARHKDGPRGGGKYKDLTPEERSEMQTKKMVDKLGLNDEQAKSLQQVNLDFAKKRKAMMDEKKADRDANRAEMKKLNDEQKTAIDKILTSEQKKQWEEMKPEHGRRPHGNKGKGDGRM